MPTRARSCTTSLALVVDVLAVELIARDAALDGVVHAVQAAQERRLAAARRADHRDHLVAADVEADVPDRVLVAVVDVDPRRTMTGSGT
jgi:hypothetical protein